MISEIIKNLRSDSGLSLRALAEKAKISKSTLSDIENNNVSPTTATLEKIATAFNITLSELMGINTNQLKEEVNVYDTINKDLSNIINIPILGVVRAGKPILVQENTIGYLPTLKEFIDTDKNYFYLKVKGDSMNQEFKEGSLLLIEKTPCIENGEIGVVLIDGQEATVKKVIQNQNMITLIPMSNNPIYVPKMYDIQKDEIQIIGIVKQAIKVY